MTNKERNEIQQEILSQIPSNAHGLLKLAPRVGKTKITIDYIKREKIKKILWVTPSTKLRDEDIPSEFVKWKAKRQLNNSKIICYASLKEEAGEYDLVVLDEYQYITEDNTDPLFNGNIKYGKIIGLSGSHPKHLEKQEILDKLKLSILIDITIDQAVEQSLIADYNITIVECKLNSVDKTIKAGNKTKSWFQTEADAYNYLTRNIFRPFFIIKRMKFIYDSTTKEKTAIKLLNYLKDKGRKMVFCSSIEQAERLGNGETYHSKTNNTQLNRFINKEIDNLYCVRSGGVGYTYNGVDHFVIIQADSDKKGETTQKLARSLLSQKDGYKGNIWFICLADTKDKNWLTEALSGFDQSKIQTIKIEDLEWN